MTHTPLVIGMGVVIATIVASFAWATYLTYRIVVDGRKHFAEMHRLTRAVAGLVDQEEAKTRALLREHGAP